MAGQADRLGGLLAREGLVSEQELEDVLALQQTPMPLASLCYVLGYADEEPLARLLSRQKGVPAVVLDRSIIDLDVLAGPAAELALESRILPLSEDRRHLLVAVEDPEEAAAVLRELEFVRGKRVVPHLALRVTLARSLRACTLARARGDRLWVGPEADRAHQTGAGSLYVVSVVDPAPPGTAVARAQEAVIEDVTKEVLYEDVLGIEEVTSLDGTPAERVLAAPPVSAPDKPAPRPSAAAPAAAAPAAATPTGPREVAAVAAAVAVTESASATASAGARLGGGTPKPAARGDDGAGLGPGGLPVPIPAPDTPVGPLVSASTAVKHMRPGAIEVIDLDAASGRGYRPFHDPPARVLVVDDDFASRDLMIKELGPLGYAFDAAADGSEAIQRIKHKPPDVVVVDIMLPEIDGFQVCRAIKQSHKYRQIGVVLMSAVIDSGRVTDEVLREYGADAYFEKPVHLDRLKQRLKTLLAARGAEKPPGNERSFERAISLYRAGKLDAAVGELRRGLSQDPLSAKHHFVLANLLHKQSLIYEAIDEYEATLEIKPDYFPALTRLAYLYYKQGFAAKAVDTWRRSLPLCPDPALRKNIEVFMRKLITDLNQDG